MAAELPPLDDSESVNPELRRRVAQRSTLVSVVVNIGLTVLQLLAGIWAHSQALVADAIHSLSDLLSDFLVLLVNRHSHKAADDDHQYGHQRYETAASLVLGLLLTGVAVGMLWGAIDRLTTPEEIPKVQALALYVAAGTLLAKELLFRYLLAAAEQVRSSMLVANAWHARSDAASSLVVALGIAGNLLGYPLLDPVAALIVGLMVLRMGWRFAWDALNDLMDRAASKEQIDRIREILVQTTGVRGVHELRTRKMGDLILVDVHLEVDGQLSVLEGHEISLNARQRVMSALPVLNVQTHLDPV
jgi:cation diffusion facilitator family transporter